MLIMTTYSSTHSKNNNPPPLLATVILDANVQLVEMIGADNVDGSTACLCVCSFPRLQGLLRTQVSDSLGEENQLF